MTFRSGHPRASRLVPVLAGLAGLAGLAIPGCDRGASEPPPAAPPPAIVPAVPPVEPAAADGPLVVFLGDSLTAGFGLPEDEAFPAVLEGAFAAAGRPIRVVNAGVSGDTTTGGLRRLDWLLRQAPDVVVIGLGANDGLRGLDLAATEANLRAIVAGVRGAGAEPVLLGMRIPTNYGPDYAEPFAAIYGRVAAEESAALVPLVLEGVGGVDAMNLADGIHPNAAGHRRMAETIRPVLERVLEQVLAEPAAPVSR